MKEYRVVIRCDVRYGSYRMVGIGPADSYEEAIAIARKCFIHVFPEAMMRSIDIISVEEYTPLKEVGV